VSATRCEGQPKRNMSRVHDALRVLYAQHGPALLAYAEASPPIEARQRTLSKRQTVLRATGDRSLKTALRLQPAIRELVPNWPTP
jgi:hypothetical protein